jgi:hypothetical protein
LSLPTQLHVLPYQLMVHDSRSGMLTFIPHVVDLVKYYPSNFSHDF